MRKRGCLWLLFGLLYFNYIYVHQDYHGGTPISRLDLLHSLIVHKTFKIDAYHNNTGGKALHRGHYYSDKAPGTVAVALPAFAFGALILKQAGIELDSERGWLYLSWIACAGSLALLTALGGVAMFLWLCRWVDERSALVTVLAIFLGAAPFPYATMMFSHSIVIALITFALLMMRDFSPARTKISPGEEWCDRLAGICCGFALACEFTAGIILSALFVVSCLAGIKRLVNFSGGAAVPALLIPAYSWICFGNPFSVGYSYQASFPQMHEGLFGIKWPTLDVLTGLLFSPARGLYFWSPFLAFAFLGYVALYRKSTRLFWLTYLFPLLQISVICGYAWDWKAGPSLGPRYLSPMLPLLALPCALAVARFPKTGMCLAAISVLLTGTATLITATPGDQQNPLLEIHIPALMDGRFANNLGKLLGLPTQLSCAPLWLALGLGIRYLWSHSEPRPDTQFICPPASASTTTTVQQTL